MGNLSHIDTSDAGELMEGFAAVPPGMYELYMESSEFKSTKDGEGEYLACVFVIGRDEYEGKKIFCNFNLVNKNPKAVDIAKAKWRAICEACLGQPNAINNESSSLHNKLFVAEVENKPAYNKATGKNDHPTNRTNEIVFLKGSIMSSKEYFNKKHETKPVAHAAETAQSDTKEASKVTPGKGTPPWGKK